MPDPSTDPNAQRLFAGKYRLLRRIAQGGTADVFLAKLVGGSAGFEKDVVVKRILPELSRDPALIRMLIDEARTAATIHHPNVVDIYEVGEDTGEWFIAMELVDGATVREIQGRYAATKTHAPVGFTLAVIAGAARGLHHAHARTIDGVPAPVIHRDVKPHNILVSPDGAIKVVDFGIALSREHAETTETGVVKGTPGYLSPEQIRHEKIGPASDQFSLGIILWELLTGERLFWREEVSATIRAILEETVARPSALGAPALLDEIVLTALAKDPAKRHASCLALAEALEHAARALAPDWSASSFATFVRSESTASVTPEKTGATSPTLATGPAVSRGRARGFAIVAAVLALVGAAGVGSMRMWSTWRERNLLAGIRATDRASGARAALDLLDADVVRDPGLATMLAPIRRELDAERMIEDVYQFHRDGEDAVLISNVGVVYPHDGAVFCATGHTVARRRGELHRDLGVALYWFAAARDEGNTACVDERVRAIARTVLDNEDCWYEGDRTAAVAESLLDSAPVEAKKWEEHALASTGVPFFNAIRILRDRADPRGSEPWVVALYAFFHGTDRGEALLALQPLEPRAREHVARLLDQLDADDWYRSNRAEEIDALRRTLGIPAAK